MLDNGANDHGANGHHQTHPMMFSVDRFTGEADEHVEEFLEVVKILFISNKVYYRDQQTRAKAILLYLSSRLEELVDNGWPGR